MNGAPARLAILILLAACTREAPSTTAEPLDRAAPRPAPPPLSRFGVPLTYDFSSTVGIIERAVPRTFGSLDSVRMIGTDPRRHYAFEAVRGPFTAFARDGELHLRAVVSYRARGFYKPPLAPTISAGCGSERERPRIQLELASPLTLTSDWRLSSRARLVRIAPLTTTQRDRCDVSFLNKDVTDRVVGAARDALVEHLPDIDRRVGRVDLRSRFVEWWGLLNRPIHLADSVWLVLGPERLRMGKVGGHDRLLVIPVTLDARPRIVTGNEPQVVVPPLPPLARDTVSDGFHITLDGAIDYGTASRALTEALSRSSIVEGGRTLRVTRVDVRPAAAGRLALAATFAGDAKGTLQLVGTPRLDPARRELTVPDLDYDLSVDDRLVRTFAWLKSDDLRRTLRERARFPVDSALARGRSLLLEGLNRTVGDALTLSATVDSVAVEALFVTLDAIVVRAEARGRAGVAVVPR